MTIPEPVSLRLRTSYHRVTYGDYEFVRITPLLLKVEATELLNRRRNVFDGFKYAKRSYGWQIESAKTIRSTRRSHLPASVKATFDLLALSDSVGLLTSYMRGTDYDHGPRVLERKAYPLALHPRLTSTRIVNLVKSFGERAQSSITVTGLYGITEGTGRSWQDLNHWEPDEALATMTEQRRIIHRVRFTGVLEGRELKAAFDRYLRLYIFSGSSFEVVKLLQLPAVNESIQEKESIQVTVADSYRSQQEVVMKFRRDVLSTIEQMERVFSVLSSTNGVAVSMLHLNPLLHAQAVDFLTGATVDVYALPDDTVRFVPVAGQSTSTIERMSAELMRHFSEAVHTSIEV